MSVNYILGSRYLLNDDIDITSRECVIEVLQAHEV